MFNMKRTLGNTLLAGLLLGLPVIALAAVEEVSASASLLRMVLGLAAVLGIMVLIAWLMKRVTPGLKQQSVVRIVGGVSVGSRERVVVVEVADRWLVLGVAPGQVTQLANLDPGQELPPLAVNPVPPIAGKPFASWLKQSLQRKP